MTDPKRYLITSALPYANGPKHIGHLAGAYLPADIYVRYLRAQKKDVVYVCGSDEHGAAITIQAMKENTTPREIVDKYHAMLKSNMADLGISFDIYHRTTEQLHHETAQEFFTVLNDKGDLEVKDTEQYFDEQANTFLADRYIVGTCPVCGNDNAFGDQCERCGTSLSPEELINPRSTLSGNAPIKKLTKHWYLPLDRHEEFLRKWILDDHKNDWKANVLGQCKSWLDAGLQPRAVTRDLDWGIKVPSPPAPQGGFLDSDDSDTPFDYQTADPFVYGLLKEFVAEHRSNPTTAEDILWQILRGKKLDGYKFRRQHIIGDFIADFVCLNKRLIIEVDGLVHQTPENSISDEERTTELNRLGFEVIRFTNQEVINQTDEVLNKILHKLTEKNTKLSDTKNPPSGGRGAGGAGKVLYVWFDAPIGYISATKQWAIDNKKDWKPYWYDEGTKLVHFIGKDNIVFHAIIFPVMLKLHGNILPDNVPSNEFMNLEGDKMSTSRGWSIEMEDYINDFVKKENGGDQMVDALRYYLTAIAPETKDSEFTWKGFQDAVKGELVDVFGNFVNRAFVLMHKLCKGKVPPLHADILDDVDKALFAEMVKTKTSIENLLETYKFRDAQYEVIDLARKGNKYMQEKQPWIVAKQVSESGQITEAAQKIIDNCLHICLQLTANLAVFINPFLPFAAKKMCYMMKVVDKMLDWENAGKGKLLSVGYSLREPRLLFRKIEDSEVKEQVEKLKIKSSKLRMESKEEASLPSKGGFLTPPIESVSKKENSDQPAPLAGGDGGPKPEIVFDDFAKIDLKVGTILTAEKVAKADKLLKLEVDMGIEKRTIVSGIAQHFDPADIIGKQVVVVANLAPRKMRGIESNGMILMAEDKAGKLHFVSPENAIESGSGVS
ncbi:MAG: methionyl-tRNA synthetase [Ferruginibacter sp.]|nr:methionyl-tRNA synthetase [Ferruginibacter sp.]